MSIELTRKRDRKLLYKTINNEASKRKWSLASYGNPKNRTHAALCEYADSSKSSFDQLGHSIHRYWLLHEFRVFSYSLQYFQPFFVVFFRWYNVVTYHRHSKRIDATSYRGSWRSFTSINNYWTRSKCFWRWRPDNCSKFSEWMLSQNKNLLLASLKWRRFPKPRLPQETWLT